MDNWLIAALLGGTIGLIMGYYIARKSAATKPILGGPAAYAMHYLAAASLAAVAPTLFIAAVFLHVKFAQSLIIGLTLIGIGAVALLIFGFLESQRQPTN